MSTGECYALANWHLRNMWKPTPWNCIENAFDCDADEENKDMTAAQDLDRLNAVLQNIDQEEDDGAGVVMGGLANAEDPLIPAAEDDAEVSTEPEYVEQQKAMLATFAPPEDDDHDEMLMQIATMESELLYMNQQMEKAKTASDKLAQRHVQLNKEKEAITFKLDEKTAEAASQKAKLDEKTEEAASQKRGMLERINQVSERCAKTTLKLSEEVAGHKRTRSVLDRTRADLVIAQNAERAAKDEMLWTIHITSQPARPTAAPEDGVIDLVVEYADKDEASARGARWDKPRHTWYLPSGKSLRPVIRWYVHH